MSDSIRDVLDRIEERLKALEKKVAGLACDNSFLKSRVSREYYRPRKSDYPSPFFKSFMEDNPEPEHPTSPPSNSDHPLDS